MNRETRDPGVIFLPLWCMLCMFNLRCVGEVKPRENPSANNSGEGKAQKQEIGGEKLFKNMLHIPWGNWKGNHRPCSAGNMTVGPTSPADRRPPLDGARGNRLGAHPDTPPARAHAASR